VDEDAVIERCGAGDVTHALQSMSDDITSCFPFSKSTKLEGVWVRGFELSEFYENTHNYDEVKAEAVNSRHPATWFSITGVASKQFARQAKPDTGETEAFYVELMGKRSLCEGAYGHMGYASHEVIATEFSQITAVQAPEGHEWYFSTPPHPPSTAP